MYKFTNGKVCFDETMRDKYIKLGYILVEEKPVKEEPKVIEIVEDTPKVENDENNSKNRFIQSKYPKSHR